MPPDSPKPQLHASDIHSILACGYRWFLKKIRGLYEPKPTHLVLGTSQHRVAYEDLSHQLDKNVLLPDEQIPDLARDTFLKTWEEGEVILDPDEFARGLSVTKGHLTDIAIAAALIHHHELAPNLRPLPAWGKHAKGLEWKWVLEAKGHDYDLAGTADVVEGFTWNGQVLARVRDLKVLKQRPSQAELDQDSKETLYAMAVKAILGMTVQSVWRDALIKPTKTLGVRLVSLFSSRDDRDSEAFIHRFEAVQDIIRKEAFLPANPAEPWAPCHTCGFAPTCKYFTKKPKTVSFSQPLIKMEDLNGNHARVRGSTATTVRKVIKPGSPEWLAAISG